MNPDTLRPGVPVVTYDGLRGTLTGAARLTDDEVNFGLEVEVQWMDEAPSYYWAAWLLTDGGSVDARDVDDGSEPRTFRLYDLVECSRPGLDDYDTGEVVAVRNSGRLVQWNGAKERRWFGGSPSWDDPEIRTIPMTMATLVVRDAATLNAAEWAVVEHDAQHEDRRLNKRWWKNQAERLLIHRLRAIHGLTPRHVSNLAHALGSSHTSQELGWRNHFVSGTSGEDFKLWSDMVAMGIATRVADINCGRDAVFLATAFGKAIAKGEV